MAKFIELSIVDEKYLVNVETIPVIGHWDKGATIYTTSERKPVIEVDQSYEFVKDAIFNITE